MRKKTNIVGAICALAFSIVSFISFSQTALTPGDIAIIAYNTDVRHKHKNTGNWKLYEYILINSSN